MNGKKRDDRFSTKLFKSLSPVVLMVIDIDTYFKYGGVAIAVKLYIQSLVILTIINRKDIIFLTLDI